MKPRSSCRAARWAAGILAVLAAFAASRGPAQEPLYFSPLSGLANPRPGRAMHEGSWDRHHQNDDALHIDAGKTVTLFEHQGAGCVHRFWVTIAPREDVAILSEVILRMYWDGDEYPSVECPIGAFFGVGFGEQKDYISAVLEETSGGYNCFWPMPFHRSARWTLTNGSGRKLDSFYYNIDYTALDSLPADTRQFHAQFRRENPTTPGRNYTILDTPGEGHYVGTALFMAGRELYFLEGNEMVYIDGEEKPSIEGTGTEDYFCSGWYFDRGLYSAPYHGVVIKDENPARVSAYRWHIEDAIPFHKSIRFTIEHGTGNGVTADYSSVAYYYLAGPSPKPPPLPADLLPSHFTRAAVMRIPGAIEAESLKDSARVTEGGVWDQDMGNWEYGADWSGRHALFWEARGPGAEMTLPLPAPAAGRYRLTARMVSGSGFAQVRFVVNGQPAGGTVNLYAPEVKPVEVPLGVVDLRAGANPLTVTVAGKDAQAVTYRVGIDAFTLTPAP
ncbi:MAG TPA: DUF2961 domain-containing protein [Opitutaceae bacterium]|jgi:hypothetical protein|nr:DUF2961 domain-containing protein [Opitutaceae bacterium]